MRCIRLGYFRFLLSRFPGGFWFAFLPSPLPSGSSRCQCSDERVLQERGQFAERKVRNSRNVVQEQERQDRGEKQKFRESFRALPSEYLPCGSRGERERREYGIARIEICRFHRVSHLKGERFSRQLPFELPESSSVVPVHERIVFGAVFFREERVYRAVPP